jgi:hypothetical protein
VSRPRYRSSGSAAFVAVRLLFIVFLLGFPVCESARVSEVRYVSYGPPWAHYLSGYQDRLLGGPLGLPDLRCRVPDGVKHKDYRGEVLG